MNLETIKRTAKEELDAESFRAAVDVEKDRLKQYRSLWVRIFPWNINLTITRR